MRQQTRFWDIFLVGLSILLVGVLGLTVFQGRQAVPHPSSVESQVASIPNRPLRSIELRLGEGLSADLGLDRPIWVLQRESSLEFWNRSSREIRIKIRIDVGSGVCSTPRMMALIWPNSETLLETDAGSRSGTEIVRIIPAQTSFRILVVVDGFPCLYSGDPRTFFGQLQIKFSII